MASNPESTVNPSSPPADLAQLTPRQIADLIAASKVIEGPVANASTVLVQLAGNDALLVFGRPRPLISPDGVVANVAVTETTAIIHMSMATLKDLSVAIADTLKVYEQQHGEIQTDFTRQRAAAK